MSIERGELRAGDRRRSLDDRRATRSVDRDAASRRRPAARCEARPGEQQRPLAEPREQDERGDERDEGRGEPRPAASRRSARRHGARAARRRSPRRRHRGRREPEPARGPAPCCGARRGRQAQGRPRGEVDDPEREQGDRVQPDGLLLGCHWAFLADSRRVWHGASPVRCSLPLRGSAPAASKDGPNGPLWREGPKASLDVTGRCEPRSSGLGGRGEHSEEAGCTDPPEAAGLFISLATLSSWSSACSWRLPAATAPASNGPSTRSSSRSSTTARRSTSASRSSTTRTSSGSSRSAARSSSTAKRRPRKARRSSSRRTGSRRSCTRTPRRAG